MGKALTPAVFHILLALASGPLHGYAIMRNAQSSAGVGVPMGPGTVYGTLNRLLENGWVTELAGGDDRKRTFELLPTGRRALEQESSRIMALAKLVRDRQIAIDER